MNTGNRCRWLWHIRQDNQWQDGEETKQKPKQILYTWQSKQRYKHSAMWKRAIARYGLQTVQSMHSAQSMKCLKQEGRLLKALNSVPTHCIIHCEVLTIKKLSSELNIVLNDVVLKINLVKVCALVCLNKHIST